MITIVRNENYCWSIRRQTERGTEYLWADDNWRTVRHSDCRNGFGNYDNADSVLLKLMNLGIKKFSLQYGV
jgi:hypothetical protein